jgi:ribonucleoside-triphosphate reductase
MKVEFPNIASEFVALTHYCRFIPEENRRETWSEVIDRVIEFLKTNTEGVENIPAKVWSEIRSGMSTFNVMPSMRLVATAGPVAARDNSCLYNCAYLPIDSWQSFSEMLFLLMCGCGVGFSVEQENVSKLPVIKPSTGAMRDDYVIEDTREGWALALLFGLETWANGEDVVFNYEKIRPYGVPLKMMGGRASGPGPFKDVMKKTKEIICGAKGRKLTSLECHDICCFVAQGAVMGGKRRSAMISFSDVEDMEMRQSKDFTRGVIPSHRYMANNTAVFKTKPTSALFMQEFSALALSGSGERGILNVSNLKAVCPTRDWKGSERTNPCGEIICRPYEFCCLSEVVVRATDDISDLVEKVKTATWIGVIQSTYTHFPFLRNRWARNCNEERLIGVSLTGQLDNPEILSANVLKQLRTVVERTAKHAAGKLGINTPAAYTTTKPSGTVSQVVDSSPGVHPRWSKFYIRRYRIAKSDPLFQLMVDQGMPFNPENGQSKTNYTTAVFEFPVKSPDKAITRNEWDAMKQLEWYLKVQKNWSTHNVSNTVYVKDDEWIKVANFVYEHWSEIVGVSFFPHSGANYEQSPYEEITEEQYNEFVKKFPKLDFSKLGDYEKKTGDTTEVGKELACSGGKCDIL